MENNELSPHDKVEMTEEAGDLLLQAKIDEIRAETEGYREMLSILRHYEDASAKDIETYESAVSANEWLLERIENLSQNFDREIDELMDK